jgi:hypothetical protein
VPLEISPGGTTRPGMQPRVSSLAAAIDSMAAAGPPRRVDAGQSAETARRVEAARLVRESIELSKGLDRAVQSSVAASDRRLSVRKAPYVGAGGEKPGKGSPTGKAHIDAYIEFKSSGVVPRLQDSPVAASRQRSEGRGHGPHEGGAEAERRLEGELEGVGAGTGDRAASPGGAAQRGVARRGAAAQARQAEAERRRGEAEGWLCSAAKTAGAKLAGGTERNGERRRVTAGQSAAGGGGGRGGVPGGGNVTGHALVLQWDAERRAVQSAQQGGAGARRRKPDPAAVAVGAKLAEATGSGVGGSAAAEASAGKAVAARRTRTPIGHPRHARRSAGKFAERATAAGASPGRPTPLPVELGSGQSATMSEVPWISRRREPPESPDRPRDDSVRCSCPRDSLHCRWA